MYENRSWREIVIKNL